MMSSTVIGLGFAAVQSADSASASLDMGTDGGIKGSPHLSGKDPESPGVGAVARESLEALLATGFVSNSCHSCCRLLSAKLVLETD